MFFVASRTSMTLYAATTAIKYTDLGGESKLLAKPLNHLHAVADIP
jgi:hypothetical protein